MVEVKESEKHPVMMSLQTFSDRYIIVLIICFDIINPSRTCMLRLVLLNN